MSHITTQLQYICLQRPKNTGDVPRSAQSSAQRGSSCGRGGMQGRKREKEERLEEESWSISELRKRAKPFSISLRDYKGQRAAELRLFFLLWFLSLLGDFGRERERETPWLPPSAEATLCHPGFLFHLKPRQREERDSHFKRQFDLRNTQEHNLKEDLRRQLKGEYKGHTVTDAGQRNLAIPESVQRRNSCKVHETL